MAVFASPSPEMAKAAGDVFANGESKPARCNGQPCAMVFPISLHFD